MGTPLRRKNRGAWQGVLGLRAAPLLLRSAAPSPHHTHAHPAAESATPPSSSSRTLSHTSLSRRLSIASLLPFVAPPLRRLCRAKLPPCRSLMMRRRSLPPSRPLLEQHTH